MNHNLNILNLDVQGTDKHVVDVIRALIAFKSTLLFQKLHLDLKKKSPTPVTNTGKIIYESLLSSSIVDA